MSIEEVRRQIEKEIFTLNGDVERITFYLINLGHQSVGLSASEKTEQNLVKGCQTKIWFKATMNDNRVFLSVDSNTIIIKGLGSLLVRLFNGQAPEDILQADISSLYQKGLKQFTGSQRSDGLNALVSHLKSRISSFNDFR